MPICVFLLGRQVLLLQAPARNRLRTLEIYLPTTASRGVNVPIHHIEDRYIYDIYWAGMGGIRYVLGDAAARWGMT